MSETRPFEPDDRSSHVDDDAGERSAGYASALGGSPGSGARSGDSEAKDAQQTLLEQMGGVSGLAYSAVPIIVFVVMNSLTSMVPAIWTAIGVALAISVARIVRKEPLQPAISGVIGVAVCSFIAYRTGDAKGFFLLGIWTSLVYGGAFLLSLLVRWPLIGVAWSALNGLGFSWRHQRKALLGYDLATLAWTVVFAAKFIVQQWLYVADETAWLAFARIAMGYPLTGLALIVTVWAIRRAARVADEEKPADSTPRGEAPTARPRPSTG
ncbi:DUF3159 domain-containing protein [Haloactinomyces albus]|uniref:DUF3159 domain-containing protein n=1 Tax=Haloactinomyces albus TaxID=1352928 RepID=A0AAE3ZDZ7_9ACTN|nr:DUF3159 domain-containing protein [Haloactinomyces albus]MDR7303167.1 hypothetical protein [Haloactinomyces albus]